MVGLSKLARVVEVFARRLQTQETMTVQIADAIDAVLKPRGIAVLLEAEHMCMTMRGVQKPGTSTVTTQFTGIFRDDPTEQLKFFTLLRGSRVSQRGMRWRAPDPFAARGTKHELEEGAAFAPRFDADGLIVCITTEAETGDVLMVAYMNAEALALTLETGVAHYWSRSRRTLWRKGDTSGQSQTVVEMRTDCDQDAILLKVAVGGDGKACHTGRRSCFYRRVETTPGDGPHLVIDEP